MGQFISIKKGQIWGLDLTIASVIFLTGIIVLYVYAINYSSQSQKHLEELFYEGNLASELILSENDFGILSGDKVNQTKLNEFTSDYTSRRSWMGIKDNFYFVMEGLPSYIGMMNTTEIENKILVTRITIYNNKPTKFSLYIWS